MLGAAVTQLLGHLLYRVSPLDPVAFGSAIGVLAVAALLAALAPVRRAATVDPLTSIRADG